MNEVTTDQLLREWPPGYGGVERVAHELATVWGGRVWSFDVQSASHQTEDALNVTYSRFRVPCFRLLGRLHLPIPSRQLWRVLWAANTLHGHLPSPAVLLLLLLARLLRPRRKVTVHWHCFLEAGSGVVGLLTSLYQWSALRLLPIFSGVITTSPLLRDALLNEGCPKSKVKVLSCCLSEEQEREAFLINPRYQPEASTFRVLFIGRLDSYKRLDWLLQAMVTINLPWRLVVIGDGPLCMSFKSLAFDLLGPHYFDNVSFLGRLSESDKYKQIGLADLLVLPSDSSNEGFGIVQLEAMAAGIPALAFRRPRSGMGWVCDSEDLNWNQTPEELPEVLQRIAQDRSLCLLVGQRARERYCTLFARTVWLHNLRSLSF